jgi:hypothetical protein
MILEFGGNMNPLFCILLVFSAGALGGMANALLSGNGFPLPRLEKGVWCPGALSNIAVGAISALSSWALYGSGAGIDLARLSERSTISLQLSAVVGALLVGASGARWLTNEVDKKLLKESVKLAGRKNLTPEQCEELIQGQPRQILEAVAKA